MCTVLSIGVRATFSPPRTYNLSPTMLTACDDRAKGGAVDATIFFQLTRIFEKKFF